MKWFIWEGMCKNVIMFCLLDDGVNLKMMEKLRFGMNGNG